MTDMLKNIFIALLYGAAMTLIAWLVFGNPGPEVIAASFATGFGGALLGLMHNRR